MAFLVNPIKRTFGRRPARPVLDTSVEYVRAELERQDKMAIDRLRQPYFTDSRTGRNMGRDELLALSYLRAVAIDPREEDCVDPARYLTRILGEVRAAKRLFAAEEEDAEGFGAGTFAEVIKRLEERLAGTAN